LYTPQFDGIFYSTPNHPFFLHDESYDFYFSDKDLFERAMNAHTAVEVKESVVVNHSGWKTTSVEGEEHKKQLYAKDKQTFINKWGHLPYGEEE
jgi:hypothetical protein